MREFISAAAVARLLACNPKHVPELARRRLIGVRRLPGVAHDRYRLADVERLRAEAFTTASPPSPTGARKGKGSGPRAHRTEAG
jgi:hypothetical protein